MNNKKTSPLQQESNEKWTNYGDINFAEHGGCMVRYAWPEETRKKYSALADDCEVFMLTPFPEREGYMVANLKRVTVNDYADEMSEILRYSGFKSNASEMSLFDKVYEIANYHGLEVSVDGAFRPSGMYPNASDYIISRKDAATWMWELGITDEIEVPEP